MCGIAGFLSPPGRFTVDALRAQAEAACAALTHRGPDDEGAWIDPEAGAALAFRRLSIIDLTQDGHQPMISPDGRYVLVFNGEIYNYRDLRRTLEREGIAFRSQSDTEVLLAALTHWGVEKALKVCNGQFALALWDRAQRKLTLARDPFGQKPLYYGWLGKSFAFASELKALKHHPDFTGDLDRGALTQFLRHAYIPTPNSIYQGLVKLPAGCFLTLPFDNSPGAGAAAMPTAKAYWSLHEVAERGLAEPFEASPEVLLDQLDQLLRDAVRLCMVSDVPLGAFLSGGIDSSTVVALMQAESSRPVKTFSIGFHEQSFDEAHYAKAVAKHLGSDHSELYVTTAEAQAVIPKLPEIYDEPFADSSQIPTFLVSELARHAVTVSLSGDGGDEMFGGYTRYIWAQNLERAMAATPTWLRGLAAGAVKGVPVQGWDALLRLMTPLLPGKYRYQQAGHKLHKLATVFDAPNPEAMYRRLISIWQDPQAVVQGGPNPSAQLDDIARLSEIDSFTHRMVLRDSLGYLPDDILVKLDRASMAVSLEGRTPFLDHRVAEFAWRLPLDFKVRDGQGKWLLRQLLARYVPNELIERPKMGFGVPIGDWLRGGLRDWAEDLLAEQRLSQSGILDAIPIRRMWQQHLDGRHNWQHQLWCVLMFEAWRETNG